MAADSFELGFTLTPGDYRGMMRAYWRLTPARLFWVRLLRGLSLVVGALAALSWWETQEPADLAFAAALFAAAPAALLLNRLYYDSVFRKQRLGVSPTLVKADAGGITKSGPNGVSRFAWKRIWRVVDAKSQVLLWITTDKAVIIPHRAFIREADLGEFLVFARAKAAGETH